MKTDKIGEFIPGKTKIKYGGAWTDEDDFYAIQSVLDRNWWTIDEHGKKLEEELGEVANQKYVALTNSGSSALMVAYASLGLPEGSEIITGAVQFPTAISSMYYNHLTPVFVDVDDGNLSVDPRLIESAITPKTKAILAVAVAGNVPDISELKRIADEYGLILILDNCDGFGGTYKGKFLEEYFDISATSFHAAHIMNMGEGGAVFTNNKEYGDKSLSMREWGRMGGYDNIDSNNDLLDDIPADYPARYLFVNMGFNVKPLELQCAMGRTQLRKLMEIKKLRQTNFNVLYNSLRVLEEGGFLKLPYLTSGSKPSWFSFPFLANDRAELREFLEERNIETRTIFGGNITKQPAYKNFGRIVGELDNADLVMSCGMFVSVHPSLSRQKIKYIASSIIDFYKDR